MKSSKLLFVLFAFIFSLTLVSCDDDDDGVNADFAAEVEGTYSGVGSDVILVTRTGDNEITLSNSSGTFLSADIVTTISNSTAATTNFGGVETTITTYTVADSGIALTANEVAGLNLVTYNLTITSGTNVFIGVKQ